jgi:hypothetical protein
MKKVIFIEMAWLAGLFVLAFFVYEWLFTNRALDINAHDTYNADGSVYSPGFQIIPGLFFFAAFIAYLVRTIVFKFKIARITIISVVFNCLLLTYIGRIYQSEVDFFASMFSESTNNNSIVKGLFYGGDSSVFSGIRYLSWLEAFLILTLAFSSFMIGRNWRRSAD